MNISKIKMPILLLCNIFMLLIIWAKDSKINELKEKNSIIMTDSVNLAKEAGLIRDHNGDLANQVNECHNFLDKKGLMYIYKADSQEWDEGAS